MRARPHLRRGARSAAQRIPGAEDPASGAAPSGKVVPTSGVDASVDPSDGGCSDAAYGEAHAAPAACAPTTASTIPSAVPLCFPISDMSLQCSSRSWALWHGRLLFGNARASATAGPLLPSGEPFHTFGLVKRWLKRIGLGLLALVAIVVVVGGIYVYVQTSAYDASVDKVYDVAPLPLARSTDAQVIARGKHLAMSLAGCALNDCHGPELGGGKVTDAGPIGTMVAPNLTSILPAYSDGELARLIRHGLKKDGRTVRFMSVNEFNWLSDADVVAVLSFVRSVPPVARETGGTNIRTLGKVLDRKGLIPIDVARTINHSKIEVGPPPSPTAEYGRWIARLCSGCHGERMSGGKIPGTPPDFPVPLNLTRTRRVSRAGPTKTSRRSR